MSRSDNIARAHGGVTPVGTINGAVTDSSGAVSSPSWQRRFKSPDSRSEAAEALRGLVDAIVLTPDQGVARLFNGWCRRIRTPSAE